jgi:hypothetical protein
MMFGSTMVLIVYVTLRKTDAAYSSGEGAPLKNRGARRLRFFVAFTS